MGAFPVFRMFPNCLRLIRAISVWMLVVQDAKNQLSAARISLSLKSVPASGVLRYLLDQSGAKARFDEHAIVIVPK